MDIWGYFRTWKKIKVVSVGVVYIFFTLWLIFHTNQYVPIGEEDFWFRVFIGYGLLNALIFGNANLRNKLFNVKLIEFIPRFALFFSISAVIFFFILNFADPTGNTLYSLLAGVPLWLAILHGVVFAVTESVVWQGYLDYEIGHPWSELVAGVFHLGIWKGGILSVILSAGFLFMIFSMVNWYFRKNTNDLAPAIGVHVAFNIVKLGIIFSLGGVLLT